MENLAAIQSMYLTHSTRALFDTFKERVIFNIENIKKYF
jgi:hypothetical protein